MNHLPVIPAAESLPRTEADVYRCILDMARTAARGLGVERPDADDVAQDVAFLCYTIEERGGIDLVAMPTRELDAYVSRIAGNCAKQRFRSINRSGRKDAQFASERMASVYEWSRPDSSAEARLYDRMYEETVAQFPRLTRRIFLTVREGRLTHAQAAAQLGVSTSRVSRHMVIAQRAFRRMLEELGVVVPVSRRSSSRVRACGDASAKSRQLISTVAEATEPLHNTARTASRETSLSREADATDSDSMRTEGRSARITHGARAIAGEKRCRASASIGAACDATGISGEPASSARDAARATRVSNSATGAASDPARVMYGTTR